MRAAQREAASKQRTGRDWIGGVAAVGTAAAAAALALAALRRKRRGADAPSVLRAPIVLAGASGPAITLGHLVHLGGAGESESADADGPTTTVLAALHAARDAMSKAKREMIEASSQCLPALIAYAALLGEHRAYEEAHQNQPLPEDVEDAKALLEDATSLYNALVDLENEAGGEYTERVRQYMIALAHWRTLVPHGPLVDGQDAETHDASGQEEGGGLERHAGDGGETDVQRKERAMRDAHKKCVDATVNAARLKGEERALERATADEYTAKKNELEEAENEKEIAENELQEASDVAYADAVKAETIQRIRQEQALEAPEARPKKGATQPKGAGWSTLSPWGPWTRETPQVLIASDWGRARPARERRPCRATRRFL